MSFRHPSFQRICALHPHVHGPLGTDWNDPIAFSPEGVDRTLIWKMLDLSPAERLATLDRWSEDIALMRRAYNAATVPVGPTRT